MIGHTEIIVALLFRMQGTGLAREPKVTIGCETLRVDI